MATWLRAEEYDVLVEPTIPSGHTVIRPDLIIKKGGEVRVLDLCVPWESSGTSLEVAEQAKVRRYAPLDQDIRAFLRTPFGVIEGPISYHGVAVGARGAMRRQTERLLASLGLRKGACTVFKDMAIRASISMMNFIGGQ